MWQRLDNRGLLPQTSDEGSVGQGARSESSARSAGCTHSVQDSQWRAERRPVLALHRRLGRQRRERSGARNGAEARWSGGVPGLGCCIIQTRPAHTPARTINQCSTPAASRAAPLFLQR